MNDNVFYLMYDLPPVSDRNGRLFSAYINTPKGRLPVCFYFDFSGKGESEELQMVINECIELCVSELLSGLEKAEKPLRSLLFRYYEYSIWLSYGGDECYMNKGTSNYMMDCICNFAGCFLPLREYNSIRENTYKKIIWGVYEKIAADIPKHFEVKDDFQVYEPEMYD